MYIFGHDFRYAFRVLRSHPGTSLIAVVSLALGIGATSAVFSLVDGMYLRPLPVHDPDSIVWVGLSTAEGRQSGLSWLDYLEFRQAVQAFSDVAVQNRRGGQLDGQGEPELVLVTIVSDNYFPLLGVRAARGRLFREDLDAALANEPAIAISDSLWRRRFGADPATVGRSLRLNRRTFTVVGILPPDFRGLNRGIRNDVWVPVGTWKAMGNSGELEQRGTGQFELVGRLRPGSTLEQARTQLDTLSRRFQQENPGAYRGRRLTAATEEERQRSGGPSPSVLMISIVGLVVLIACANVAMLLLAQSEGRNREISIRLAVGASRWRLVRQLLAEASFLALAGGALALFIASWLIPLLPALLPPGPDFQRFDIRLDSRVLTVTLLTCLGTVLLFGLFPALEAARTDLMALIKGRGWDSRSRFAGRRLLVVAQAALSVVLLTAAALLARSFMNTQQQRLGFDTDKNMLVLLSVINSPRQQVSATCDEIAGRVRILPGIKRAAYCRRMPFSQYGSAATRDVVIPGRVSASSDEVMRIRYNQVSVDYLAATGTRLLAGRTFTQADAAGGARVALVNRTMARQFWPNGSAIEQWIRIGNADTQIVGIVEDGIISRVHETPEPFMLFPFAQLPVNEVTFVVETDSEPGTLLDSVKREMREVRPDLTLLLTTTLKQQLRDALYGDWLPAVLTGAIGLLGIFLSAAGLFGVVLHGVNRKYREMGVRMALGAKAANVIALVLGHGLVLAGAGAVVGAAASLGTGRLISSLLHGVSPHDPAALLLSVGLVIAMAAAASLYPAWKATRVDPATVLREE